MVIIDTDVLLLAFAYHRDKRPPANQMFLKEVQAESLAITIYNLMESLGQLSSNLSPQRLDAYPSWLLDAYQLTVIWPYEPDEIAAFTTFRDEIFSRPFARMRAVKMPFMDALILNLAERTPGVTHTSTPPHPHTPTPPHPPPRPPTTPAIPQFPPASAPRPR